MPKGSVVMSIYLIETELKVRHLYSVEATSEEEAKKFIYFKYNKKLSMDCIAEKLNVSRRKAYTFRKDIIQEIIKLL